MKYFALILSIVLACIIPAPSQQPDRATYQQLATQVDSALHSEILAPWFPASVDTSTAASTPITLAIGNSFPATESSPSSRVA